MEHPAQQDLPAVLRLVERGNVAVSAKTRQATAAAVRRIAAVLYDGHDRRRPQGVPGRARAFVAADVQEVLDAWRNT